LALTNIIQQINEGQINIEKREKIFSSIIF